MSKSTAVVCVFGAALLGTFIFISIRAGQYIFQDAGHSLNAITSLILFGLMGYVIVAALLAQFLGAFVFDRFITQPRHDYQLV